MPTVAVDATTIMMMTTTEGTEADQETVGKGRDLDHHLDQNLRTKEEDTMSLNHPDDIAGETDRAQIPEAKGGTNVPNHPKDLSETINPGQTAEAPTALNKQSWSRANQRRTALNLQSKILP